VEPGLVFTPLWRPQDASEPLFPHPERSATYAGVARKAAVPGPLETAP
jgi:hypothetical protein